MATINNAVKKSVTKVVLEPGMKIVLEQNGVPLTTEQLAGKTLAVEKAGNSLMVTMPDGSEIELVDFYITEGVSLDGTFWDLPTDSGLTLTASGVAIDPAYIAQTANTGVVGEAAIASDVDIAGVVADVVAETAPAAAGGGFGGVLAGLAGLGLAGGGGGGGPAAVLPTVLKVSVVAGPITNAAGLSVEAFGLDGTVLVSKTALVLGPDGTMSLTLPAGYTGAVMVRITDADSGADYRDEGTLAQVDLTVDLRALIDVSGSASQSQNITISPLTEMAVQMALSDTGGDSGTSGVTVSVVQAAKIAGINQQIAKSFGITDNDLPRIAVQPVVNADGTVATGNYMGSVLAAISGYEKHAYKTTGAAMHAMIASLKSSDADAMNDLIVGSLAVSGAVFSALGIEAKSFTAKTISKLDGSLLNAIPVATLDGLSADAVRAIPVTLLGRLSW